MSEEHATHHADLAPTPVDILRRHAGALVVAALAGGALALLLASAWPSSYAAQTSFAIGYVPADPLERPGDRVMALADAEELVSWLRAGSLPEDLKLSLPGTGVDASARERLVTFTVTGPDAKSVETLANAVLARVEADHRVRLDDWTKELAALRERIAASTANAVEPRGPSRDKLLAALDLSGSSAYVRPTRRISGPWTRELRPARLKLGVAGALAAGVGAWLALFVVGQRRRKSA